MKYIKSIIFFFSTLCGLISCSSEQQHQQQTFPGWQEGEMEIHHIYTGRGEANFMVFPDGTTMLVDAGDWDPNDYPKMCDLLPDSSRRAGAWIARYIEQMNPNKREVDYLMISHFHSDHTGDHMNPVAVTEGREANYPLTGIMETGETIRFGRVYDRGYPDYSYPMKIIDKDVDYFRAFVKWQTEQFGLQQDCFKVGALNQIVLLKRPQEYSELFSIRNLVANGEIWTGRGEETVCYYGMNPANLSDYQNENSKSMGICISYGPFRYYTAGDLSGALLDADGKTVNLEAKVGEICGQVDVCKANHHAYLDAMSEEFIRNIRARQYVISTWDHEHTQPSVIGRMVSEQLYPGKRMVFSTNIPELLRKKYAEEEWMRSVCPENGHVVVKVYDKGRSYKIYVLSATDKSYPVKAVYGPYSSGEK